MAISVAPSAWATAPARSRQVRSRLLGSAVPGSTSGWVRRAKRCRAACFDTPEPGADVGPGQVGVAGLRDEVIQQPVPGVGGLAGHDDGRVQARHGVLGRGGVDDPGHKLVEQ